MGNNLNSDPDNKKTSGERTRGEIWVWFTGMGLAVGLVMVVFLFGLITYRGLTYFWPSSVVQIELAEDSESSFHGSRTFAGVLAKTQERTDRVVAKADDEDAVDEVLGEVGVALTGTFSEIQLFIGNRDVYGLSFRYFREDEIVNRFYPEDIIRAERREMGDGIFYPSAIVYPDGRKLDAAAENFEDELDRLVREARARRAEISRLDRGEIGKINLEINSLDLELRYLRRLETRGELTDSQRRQIERMEARVAELQADFQELEAEASDLRRLNASYRLQFVRATGDEGEMAIGNLYRYHFPNRLSFIDRVGVFLTHVKDFVTTYPRSANMEGGVMPAIFGTLVMTLIMSIAVTPFGVVAAIYLREYARQGPMVRSVRIAINNLAGVPSIVYGVFGLGFFVYFVGSGIDSIFYPRSTEMNVPTFGTGGILWAGLTLALLNVPVVIVATEEALAAVSRGVREGSLACGASKWQTIRYLVLPASLPGILTGLILAMARGAGEVAPLMLVGVVPYAPNLPLDGTFPFFHLERKFMHLGFHIYDVGFQSPDSEAAIPTVFATTLVLIALILMLNLVAILIRNNLRKKHQSSAF